MYVCLCLLCTAHFYAQKLASGRSNSMRFYCVFAVRSFVCFIFSFLSCSFSHSPSLSDLVCSPGNCWNFFCINQMCSRLLLLVDLKNKSWSWNVRIFHEINQKEKQRNQLTIERDNKHTKSQTNQIKVNINKSIWVLNRVVSINAFVFKCTPNKLKMNFRTKIHWLTSSTTNMSSLKMHVKMNERQKYTHTNTLISRFKCRIKLFLLEWQCECIAVSELTVHT